MKKFGEYRESSNQVSNPVHWKSRYKNLDDYDKYTTKEMLSQGRKNAIELHKKAKGKIKVYHSLVHYRHGGSVSGSPIDNLVNRAKFLIGSSKILGKSDSFEEISVSVNKGFFQGAVILEGLGTLLAYWDTDVSTNNDGGLKIPREVIKTNWDEGIAKTNQIEWKKAWINKKIFSVYYRDIDLDEFVDRLKNELHLEVEFISGKGKELPNFQQRKDGNFDALNKQYKNLYEVFQSLLNEFTIVNNAYDGSNFKEQLFLAVWEIDKEYNRLSFEENDIDHKKLGSLIFRLKQLLKQIWFKLLPNKFYFILQKALHFKGESYDIVDLSNKLKEHEVLREIIIPKLDAVFGEQLKCYRAIFGKNVNINFLDILYKSKSIQDGNGLLASVFK
jgi:hypothetical protein